MTKPNPKLHYTLLGIALGQALVRLTIWVKASSSHIPSWEKSIGVELVLGTFVALIVAIISLANKRSAPSKSAFYTTQIVAWLNSASVIAFLILSIFLLLTFDKWSY